MAFSAAQLTPKNSPARQLLPSAYPILPRFLNTVMLTFAEYSDNPLTENTVTDLAESVLLNETTISPSLAKTAALGILLKMTQLNRTLAQSRSASADTKALSSQLLWLSSLVALSIGAINDLGKGGVRQ